MLEGAETDETQRPTVVFSSPVKHTVLARKGLVRSAGLRRLRTVGSIRSECQSWRSRGSPSGPRVPAVPAAASWRRPKEFPFRRTSLLPPRRRRACCFFARVYSVRGGLSSSDPWSLLDPANCSCIMKCACKLQERRSSHAVAECVLGGCPVAVGPRLSLIAAAPPPENR